MGAQIIGWGGYLPEREVYNSDFESFLNTNDEWIASRTGILKRHFAATDQSALDMGINASADAIKTSGLKPSSIDLVICATTTPHSTFPSTASQIQAALGIRDVPAFDIQAVCSGFVYGLHVADIMLNSGRYDNILLVCTEKMSSLLNMQDRSTCILFGDGAGSVVLTRSDSKSHIIDSIIKCDGKHYDFLHTDGGPSSTGQVGVIKMQGQQVFKLAVDKMTESSNAILSKNGLKIEDIDYFIPHQANARIIEAVAKRLGCGSEKVVITVDKHANCSAASIPLAFNALASSGKLKTGDMILFTAIGAGITYGSALLRW